ncbi:hypothetical protein [Flavobacterium sp. XGLA_31]|uniref:hypothetical protein n=1 Tax=Flavobacterium sp. XGLA_31 TaxID=3447666 RepID=UPI003F31F687
MKKIFFYFLQLLSMFFYILLITAAYGVIKEVLQNAKGLEYNLGYGLSAVLVLGFLFWLNTKLYRYTDKCSVKK